MDDCELLIDHPDLVRGEHDVFSLEEREPLTMETKHGYETTRGFIDKQAIPVQENTIKTNTCEQGTDEEREELIRKEIVTRGDIGGPSWNLMNNAVSQPRHTSGRSASVVNLIETTTTSKCEDENEELSAKDLLCFAWQVAEGMVSIHRVLEVKNTLALPRCPRFQSFSK